MAAAAEHIPQAPKQTPAGEVEVEEVEVENETKEKPAGSPALRGCRCSLLQPVG